MSEKDIYEKVYRKLKTVQENLDDAIYNLNSFCNVIDSSFKVNEDNCDKNSIKNIKEKLTNKKNIIKINILPEVNRKII